MEIGAALGASIRTGNAKGIFAYGLARLPVARELLLSGRISLPRVRKLITETQSCDDATAAEVDAQLSPHAHRWSVAELGRRAARLIGELDPDGVRRRHERQRAERCVQWEPCGDGMGWMNLYGPAEDLAAAYTAINDQALAKRRAGDQSPMGVLRFDAAIGLLTGRADSTESAGRAVVRLTVPAQTLLGLSDTPGHLDGAGPVPAHVARRLAAQAEVWERILTDPATGAPCSHDRRRYRPTEAMRQRVLDRDRHCRAPGCDAPVWRCDADHDTPWPAGVTCECNLTTFCRRHHNAKTHGGWTTKLAPDGTLTMTSPLGRTYQTKVEPLPARARLARPTRPTRYVRRRVLAGRAPPAPDRRPLPPRRRRLTLAARGAGQASPRPVQCAIVASSAATPWRASACRTRWMTSAGPLDARTAMTSGQSASPNRSTMRLAPLLSRTAPVRSEIGQLPVIASSAARGSSLATQKPPGWFRLARKSRRSRWYSSLPSATASSADCVRPADDHLPGIGDDERRTVCSVEHEDRVTEHQVLDEAVGQAQDGYGRRRTDGVGDVAGVPVNVRHLLDGLGEHGRKAAVPHQ